MSKVDMNNLPPERPLAAFLLEPQSWADRAACNGMSPRLFFEHTEDTHPTVRVPAIEKAQGICAACPVRTECGNRAMVEEGGSDESMRFGFRAYMTPQQRVSIHRRGGLLGRDPMQVVNGRDGDRDVPPVPVEGDRWSRHHTTAARKVVKWVNCNRKVGAKLPTLMKLSEELGIHHQPLKRVLDALVQDGTLDYGANKKTYVRRGTARAVSWLPLHLRHTTN